MNKNQKSALQAQRSGTCLPLCLPFFYRRYRKVRAEGSLAIEAALLFPIFLIVHLTLLTLFELMIFQADLQQAMEKVALKYCSLSSYTEWLGEGQTVLDQNIINEIRAEIPDEEWEAAPVLNGKNGVGIFVYPKNEYLYVKAIYSLDLPAPFHMNSGVLQGVRQRYFRGVTLKSDEDESDSTGDTVYITEKGSVYHTDRNCSALNVSVSTHDYSALSTIRNKSGGIYHACEYCTTGKKSGTIYTTDYGNKYHEDPNCFELKRTVKEVSIDEVGDMRACKRCSGGSG